MKTIFVCDTPEQIILANKGFSRRQHWRRYDRKNGDSEIESLSSKGESV